MLEEKKKEPNRDWESLPTPVKSEKTAVLRHPKKMLNELIEFLEIMSFFFVITAKSGSRMVYWHFLELLLVLSTPMIAS